MIMRLLRYYKGRLWLKQGFCPYCYSSPPSPYCPVCKGDPEYFGKRNKEKRDTIWRVRWDEVMRVFR